MFIIKNNYYLYIDNTKSINLDILKKPKKFSIIYRPNYPEKVDDLKKFCKECRSKDIKLYIANNDRLARNCKADGLYVSASNNNFYYNIKIIGSAHNFKEIYQKIKQRCSTIILSRLFQTTYKNKKNFYGLVKFNLIIKKYLIQLIPLGGIRTSNLLKLNLVNSNGLAIMSEIKKKPAISNRLL
tara:strand:- start:1395 stop:1946 length:552 start_codon:yes stop_codon:yes gene_type:complete